MSIPSSPPPSSSLNGAWQDRLRSVVDVCVEAYQQYYPTASWTTIYHRVIGHARAALRACPDPTDEIPTMFGRGEIDSPENDCLTGYIRAAIYRDPPASGWDDPINAESFMDVVQKRLPELKVGGLAGESQISKVNYLISEMLRSCFETDRVADEARAAKLGVSLHHFAAHSIVTFLQHSGYLRDDQDESGIINMIEGIIRLPYEEDVQEFRDAARNSGRKAESIVGGLIAVSLIKLGSLKLT